MRNNIVKTTETNQLPKKVEADHKKSSIVVSRELNTVTINLQYLSEAQAKSLIKMFDSPDEYAENFSAIKAITRGLNNLLLENKPGINSPIGRMFNTVNEMQGTLMRDSMQEHQRILDASGLMPDQWRGFNPTKGGASC